MNGFHISFPPPGTRCVLTAEADILLMQNDIQSQYPLPDPQTFLSWYVVCWNKAIFTKTPLLPLPWSFSIISFDDSQVHWQKWNRMLFGEVIQFPSGSTSQKWKDSESLLVNKVPQIGMSCLHSVGPATSSCSSWKDADLDEPGQWKWRGWKAQY